MSPTARSLAFARLRGYVGGVVEVWNAHARVRQDFLGFADLLFVVPGELGVLAIQACVTGDQAKRLAKIQSDDLAPKVTAWLAAGNRIAVWGWAKRGARGKRKTWTLSETFVPASGASPGAAGPPEAGAKGAG